MLEALLTANRLNQDPSHRLRGGAEKVSATFPKWLRVCPESTGRYMMHVRMVSGTGSYVSASYRWPRGTRLGDLVGVLYVRLSEVTALLNVEGFQPDPGYGIERCLYMLNPHLPCRSPVLKEMVDKKTLVIAAAMNDIGTGRVSFFT